MKSILSSVAYRAKFIARSLVRTLSVWRQSRYLKSLLTGVKKGLFIDCGANLGQGFTFFSRFYTPDKFNYLVIEPNPYCQETLRDVITRRVPENQIEMIEMAASTKHGSCLFYGLAPTEGGKFSEGASIVADHNAKYYEACAVDAIEVKTFPLDELIDRYKKDYEIIVLKLDVEGAEYQIMPHLFDTGSAQKLKQLYIEFHSQDVSIDLQPAREYAENEIIKKLSQLGVGFTRWI